MAGDFLREEGFTGDFDTYFAPLPQLVVTSLATGHADIGVSFANTFVGYVDAGQPIVALGGIHPGCAQLWARPGIDALSDLKGKTVAVQAKTVTVNNKTAKHTLQLLRQLARACRD